MSHAPKTHSPEQQKRRAAARARKFWFLRTFLVWPGVAILKLLMATWRVRVHPPDAWATWSQSDRPGDQQPEVLAIVHGSVLCAIAGYRKALHAPRRPLAILISPSQDGLLLADIVRRFDMKVVTGSSSKRAAASVLELMDVVRSGTVGVIAVDGPRGPRFVPRAGALLLARETGARLRLMTAAARWAVRLPSWDRLLLPLPFARIDIRGVDLDAQALLGNDGSAAAAARFQQALLAALSEAGEPLDGIVHLTIPPTNEASDAHHRG